MHKKYLKTYNSTTRLLRGSGRTASLFFGALLLTVLIGMPNIASAKSASWSLTSPTGLVLANWAIWNTKQSEWYARPFNFVVTINRHAFAKKKSTLIKNGSTVRVGDTISFSAPIANTDIPWSAGYFLTQSNGIGHWVANAAATFSFLPVANAGNPYTFYTFNWNFNTYAGAFSVNPSSITYTHTGSTAGLSCNSTGSSCKVTSSNTTNGAINGIIKTQVKYGATYGEFYYYEWHSPKNYSSLGKKPLSNCPVTYKNLGSGFLCTGGLVYTVTVPAQQIQFTFTAKAPTPSLKNPNPPTITGPSSAIVGTAQTFTFKATDTNKPLKKIRYAIDWNANKKADQYAPATKYVSSGTSASATFTLPTTGTSFKFSVRTESNTNPRLVSKWISHTVSLTQPKNGSCGSANGLTLPTIPTIGLCSASTPSSVSGSGSSSNPWAWTCASTNGGTTASCSALLSPPTATLSAAKSSIVKGVSTTLKWTSGNATNGCTGTGFSTGNTKATSGKVKVSPTATTRYKIKCTNSGGSITKYATVIVKSPSSCSGTATWSGTNATCSDSYYILSGGSKTVNNTSINYTGSVTLSCSNSVVTQSSSSCAPIVPTVTFFATKLPAAVNGRSVFVLNWTSQHATGCTGTGFSTGNVNINTISTTFGSAPVSPTATTRYKIKCTNSGISTTKYVTVTVSQPASCSASTATWSGTNATCSNNSVPSISNGSSVTVNNTSINYTGSVTLSCSNNVVTQSSSSCAPIVPTATLSATPNPIPYGKKATLTWGSSNATSCTAGGPWSNASKPLGPKSGLTNSLTSNTTFTYQCSNAGGSLSLAKVTVTVNPPLTCSASTATWSGTNATCSNNSVPSISNGSSVTVSNNNNNGNTGSVTLSCLNGVVSQPTSSCVPPPPTATLTTASSTIVRGGSTILTWSSRNATNGCTGLVFPTGNATSGSATVSPLATAGYAIKCTNSGGSTTKNISIKVINPRITSFSVSPSRVLSGKSVVIDWTTTDMQSCTVTNPSTTISSSITTGSETDTVTTQTTYTLSCIDKAGNTILPQSRIVNVVPSIKSF